MTSAHVLVVEDDSGMRDVLARALREEGYRVTTAADGTSALAAKTSKVDAAILDIGLPDADGRDVCHALRAGGFVAPVLFLTALGGMSNVLTGFASGGDDYLAKPFHVAELLARLSALIRRSVINPSADRDEFRLDPAGHAVVGSRGCAVLTPIEFRLLGSLMSRPDTVVRRRDLRRAAWPEGAIVADNTLDQYMTKLRRKLLQAEPSRTIDTVRGVGYRLT
jgi:DNA-binding response OmpR family regulator